MNCILACKQFITKRMTWICYYIIIINFYSEEKPYDYMLRFSNCCVLNYMYTKSGETLLVSVDHTSK